MKKLLLAVIVFLLLALPVSLQLSSVNVAEAVVTPPVSFFNLSGKVTLKQLGRLMHGLQRLMPAPDVLVEVTNFWNSSEKYTTETDGDGMYHLQVPDGLYKVKVSDEDDTFFVPPFTVVKLKENKEKQVNFQGLIFP